MYRRRRRYYRSSPEKFDKAAEMRNNPTRAEARMYEILYSEVVPKYPEHIFYRQSVQFGYILDFYCPTLRLGIEVDGALHDERKEYDRHRDTVLGRKNIQVFRFNNSDILYNPHIVASRLCQIVEEKNTYGGFIPAPAYRTTVGQTLQEQTNSNCFIATAAYGTKTAEELDVLRKFRDLTLESNLVGRQLADLYYLVSPPFANIIARSKNMRAFVRLSLKPIIRYLE
jgi:very-short-patch-repair endonuclease